MYIIVLFVLRCKFTDLQGVFLPIAAWKHLKSLKGEVDDILDKLDGWCYEQLHYSASLVEE